MANVLMTSSIFSTRLMLSTGVNVILPDVRREGDFPVLWLLHGGSGNQTDWLEYSKIRLYADKHQIAVVMPAAGPSRYCNMYWGADYYDYLVDELPQIIKHLFPRISMRREDQFIAGLSLGGSGALSLGMRSPEKYSVIGILSASSIIPLEHLRAGGTTPPPSPAGDGYKSINMINFGLEDTADLKGNPEHDCLLNAHLIIEQGKPVPKVYHACGTEDHAYPVALGLKAFFDGFEGNPFRYELHTEPGAHNWYFWDKWIEKFLDAAMEERRQQYGTN